MNEKQLLDKSKLIGARVINFRDFFKSNYSSTYNIVFTLPQLIKLVGLVQANSAPDGEIRCDASTGHVYGVYWYEGQAPRIGTKVFVERALEKIVKS